MNIDRFLLDNLWVNIRSEQEKQRAARLVLDESSRTEARWRDIAQAAGIPEPTEVGG